MVGASWWVETAAEGVASGAAGDAPYGSAPGASSPRRLRAGLPKRLMVPSTRVPAARRRDLGEAIAVDGPRWLPVDWEPVTAGTLDVQVRLAPDAPSGSVDLTLRSWYDAPPLGGVDDRALRPDAPADGLHTFERPHVPLWKRLAALLQPRAALLLAPAGPVEWPGTLFPYQVEGVYALLSRESLLLADDMGCGKTVQAIAALRILALQRQMEAALLIVPAGLLGQWRRALREWAPELLVTTIRGPAVERAWQWRAPAHVYLTSYETFREDFTDNPHAPPRQRTWDVVLLDEAHRIKNAESEVSRKCKQVRRRRAWALTGTPVENSLDDLASVLEFLAPPRDGDRPPRPAARAALFDTLRTVQVRRRKADVLPQLPPKIISDVTLPLTRAQRETYDRAEREGVSQLHERGESVRTENVLDLVVRLKQICNFCPVTGRSAKLEDLQQRLATLAQEGHRALVFSQFTDARYGVRALASRLHALRPLVYTGDLSPQQREAAIREFKEDRSRKVLILSLRAGGTGLNLQEASYVFHFDRWWNPAVERQAEDRSHRIGQAIPVNVYSYTSEGTIEERIAEVLRQKQSLFDLSVDDVTLDLRAAMTADELFGLFGLAPPG